MKTSCDAIQNNICGIYLIRNKINNKIYIGQSIDIRRRAYEHFRSGQPEKYSIKSQRDINTPLHLAMQKYGITNFTIEILEKCEKNLLDEKEKYYIQLFQSNNRDIGYNITDGGQKNFALKGEEHSQAKLTQKEVNQIKDLLKNTEMSLREISIKFNNISTSTLSMINHGKIWYDNKEKYPIRIMNSGQKGDKNARAKLTDNEVMEIRKLQSQGATYATLPIKYTSKVGKSSIYNILSGSTFKHLPIWDKTNKKWIEPCIDYSLGSK